MDIFANQVTACDLVISIENSIVQMTGKLARTVCTLQSHNADWRWPLDNEELPWHLLMRQLPLKGPGDWYGSTDRMANELRALVSKRKRS